MSFDWNEPGGILGTEFDLTFDFVPLGSPQVDLYPPDPVHTPESIALGFPVMTFDGQGVLNGLSNTWVTLEFDEQQLGSLEFVTASVTPNRVAGGGTSGFTLHFRMDLSGMNSPDDQFPLFHATWMSDWSTEVATGAPFRPVVRSPDALRLVAIPAVTSAGAEIRTSRPLERATEILVHDVTGRQIRALPLAVGARDARWDGRDANGAPTAAGVYFVRLTGNRDAVTRVVRVR